MKPKKLPSVEVLREWYHYDPTTGALTLRKHRKNKKVGQTMGTKMRSGHLRMQHDRVLYLVHRICWKIHYGEEPPDLIDHADGDPAFNAVDNMRSADKAQNAHNTGANLRNSTGIKGLTVDPRWAGRYKARITTKKGRLSANFPLTDEGKKAAIEWMDNTRKEHHKEFANNGI